MINENENLEENRSNHPEKDNIPQNDEMKNTPQNEENIFDEDEDIFADEGDGDVFDGDDEDEDIFADDEGDEDNIFDDDDEDEDIFADDDDDNVEENIFDDDDKFYSVKNADTSSKNEKSNLSIDADAQPQASDILNAEDTDKDDEIKHESAQENTGTQEGNSLLPKVKIRIDGILRDNISEKLNGSEPEQTTDQPDQSGESDNSNQEDRNISQTDQTQSDEAEGTAPAENADDATESLDAGTDAEEKTGENHRTQDVQEENIREEKSEDESAEMASEDEDDSDSEETLDYDHDYDQDELFIDGYLYTDDNGDEPELEDGLFLMEKPEPVPEDNKESEKETEKVTEPQKETEPPKEADSEINESPTEEKAVIQNEQAETKQNENEQQEELNEKKLEESDSEKKGKKRKTESKEAKSESGKNETEDMPESHSENGIERKRQSSVSRILEQGGIQAQLARDSDRDPYDIERNIGELFDETRPYLGFMSIISSPYGFFYNFYPVAVIDENGEVHSLNLTDLTQLFPTIGNVNIRWKPKDEAKFADMFQDGAMYAIDLGKNNIEDNIRGNGLLNMTNKRVDLSIHGDEIIHNAEDVGCYRVFEVDNLSQKLREDKIITISARMARGFTGSSVMLRDGNRYIGPFSVYNATEEGLYVTPGRQTHQYIYDVYTVNLDDSCLYNSSNIGTLDISETVYINISELTPEKEDFISDAELLVEFGRVLQGKKVGDTSEAFIAESVFNDLQLPFGIMKRRQEKILEIFRRQKSFDGLMRNLSQYVNDLIVIAAQNNDEIFDATFSELVKRDGFMLSIQRCRIIADEIERRQSELDDLNRELHGVSGKIARSRHESDQEQGQNTGGTTAQKKKKLTELDEKLNSLTTALGLAQDVDELRTERQKQEELLQEKLREQKALQDQTNAIMDAFNAHTRDAMGLIAQVVMQDQVASIIQEARGNSPRLLGKSTSERLSQQIQMSRELSAISKTHPEHIPDLLVRRVQQYRNYPRNDIVNLFICLVQGFLTVFSGAPGTGKTSVCSIAAHALGLDNFDSDGRIRRAFPEADSNRFVFVPVERGWSSKRDFIGYYNPLTKQVDKNNRRVYQALEMTSSEKAEGAAMKVAPYIILLDEANLSPMEYYWADFMAACDMQEDLVTIDVSEDVSFNVSESLRFMATINNDHTTEALSPRLIDRAFVITLPQPGIPSKLHFTEYYEPISMEKLQKAFGNAEDDPMNLPPVSVEILKQVYSLCREKLNIEISPRVEYAIRQYCYTGTRLFSNLEIDPAVIAVDYAVAQKVLPKIQGSGTEYRRRLEEFMQILIQNNLLRSIAILKKIIQNGDKNMQYYQFFC